MDASSMSQAFSWVSSANHLMLNPRLPEDLARRYEFAWKNLVSSSFDSQIGIATSGSISDHGRLIAIPKSSVLVSAQAVNERLESTSRDVWMKTLPDFHVGGLGIRARAHLSGARVVESTLSKWVATDAYRELEGAGATLLSLVPTQLFDFVSLRLKAPRALRAVVIGGGRLEESLRVEALSLGWPVLPSYGLTECGSQVATAVGPHDPSLLPLSHVELRIGAAGRIEISSAALLSGQIVFDEKMNAHFTDPKIQGWFRTEDRGHIDERGLLHVSGRVQDFVKIGGEGVILSRLEETLGKIRIQMKAAPEAVILAAQDDRLGAKIVLIAEGDTQSLVESFNAAVLPFERIRAVYRVERLPRSAIGKVLRRQALTLVGLKPLAHD